jgi:hypothetical protein
LHEDDDKTLEDHDSYDWNCSKTSLFLIIVSYYFLHTNYFPMKKGKGTIASVFHPLHTNFFPMQKGGIVGVDGGNKLAIV